MTSLRTLILGGVTGMLIGGGVVYLHPWSTSLDVQFDTLRTNDSQSPAIRQELTYLRDEVVDLRHQLESRESTEEVASLQQQVAALQQRFEAAGLDSSSPAFLEDHDDRLDNGDLMASVEADFADELSHREQLDAHFAELDGAHRSEIVDPAWSDGVTGELQDLFAGTSELLGVGLSDIDCRSIRCRIEIEFDEDEVDSDEVEMAIAEHMAEETPGIAVHYLEDDGFGTRRAVVYLARRGDTMSDE